MRRPILLLTSLLALAGVAAGGLGPARAACDPSAKIDRSTVAEARQKIEAAGYAKVTDLHKGCDNVWHGKAMKDGAPAFVALTPQGEVLREAD